MGHLNLSMWKLAIMKSSHKKNPELKFGCRRHQVNKFCTISDAAIIGNLLSDVTPSGFLLLNNNVKQNR